MEMFGSRVSVWFDTIYRYCISISLISPDIWKEIPIYVHICTELMSIKNSNVPFRRRAWLCYFCLFVLSNSSLWWRLRDFKLSSALQNPLFGQSLLGAFFLLQNKSAMTPRFSLINPTFFKLVGGDNFTIFLRNPTTSFHLTISLFLQS